MLSLVNFINAFDQAQGQENLDEPPFYLNVISKINRSKIRQRSNLSLYKCFMTPVS